MPLFRRREPEPEPLTFTVGVGDHRVIVGGENSGCALLEDVEKYAAFIARTSTHQRGTRDTVGVLSGSPSLSTTATTNSTVAVPMPVASGPR